MSSERHIPIFKRVFGFIIGLIGITLLAGIVTKSAYMTWATGDLAISMVVAFIGLFLVQLGWRVFTGQI